MGPNGLFFFPLHLSSSDAATAAEAGATEPTAPAKPETGGESESVEDDDNSALEEGDCGWFGKEEEPLSDWDDEEDVREGSEVGDARYGWGSSSGNRSASDMV